MLAPLGFLTVVVLSAAIISKSASPLVALIAVPVIASSAAGFGFKTGGFIVKGIDSIAPVGMFILAFGASLFMTIGVIVHGAVEE